MKTCNHKLGKSKEARGTLDLGYRGETDVKESQKYISIGEP